MLDRQAPLALVLAVVTLAGVSLLVLAPGDEDAVEPEPGQVDVWEIATDDVARIELARPEDTVVLVRADDGWVMESPYSGPADAWRVDDALRELERASRGVLVAEVGDDAFGLGAEPAVRVTLVHSDGTTDELRVGAQAPTGWRTYVQSPTGEVAAVEARLDRLSDPAAAFRDRSMLRFAVPDVERVVLTGDEGELDVALDDRGRWWVDGLCRAEPNRVDDLLVGLLGLRFDEVLADVEEPLEDAARSVQVELRDGRQVGLQVARRPLPRGQLVRTSEGVAGSVQDSSLALLGQGPPDVCDPMPLRLPAGGVGRLELSVDGAGLVLERGDSGWLLDGEPSESGVSTLNAVEGVPWLYLPERPQLEDPVGYLDVTPVEGERYRVAFGPVVGRARAARDERGGPVYWLDADALARALMVP